MLAVPSEPETIGNNGPRTKLDHQISLPQREVEEPSEADRVEPPSHMPELINKQNSIFSLTLDEIQSKNGRSFGSMNMEELIANIWSVEEKGRLTVSSPQANQLDSNDAHRVIISDNITNERACNDGDKDSKSTDLSRQGSFSIPIPLCKKTVDEIWLEMHKEECAEQLDQPEKGTVWRGGGGGEHVPQRQQTLGEMTLEDFLVKAGIVKESLQQVEIKQALEYKSAESNGDIAIIDSSGTNGDLLRMSNGLTAFAAYQAYGQGNVAVGQHHEVASYGNNGDYYSVNAHEKRTGNLTETSGGAKSKKRIVDGPPEVVVERRQRRMIKNRESAARSRARKQAYTVELEVELNQLKEENEKLKQVMAEAELKRKQEVLKKMKQYSTKAQKLAIKLRTIRRATSLAW